MITVGPDFGTHQTKVCIEDKDGVELNYTFLTFFDANKNPFYTLPAMAQDIVDTFVSGVR